MKNSKTTLLLSIFFLLLWLPAAAMAEGDFVADEKRNKLIGYMLGKQLPSIHYSDKQVDDELSRAAFDLYIKQLDFQKRFLLATDVAELDSFSTVIDDNLLRGAIGLPRAGYRIMVQRISQVEKMVDEILAERLDANVSETLETDPEKLAYAASEAELRQRWRKILKAQIMNRYLDLEDEYRTKEETIESAPIWGEATERVSKRFKDFFNRLDQETLQDHYDRFFNAVARAFDPHTNYMPPDRKEDFDIHMRGSLEGIGALLREEYGYIKVVRIIPGSASAKEGRLQAEDIIMAVAEKDEEPVEVTDMRLRDAVRLIRGPKGTVVELTVRKPDGTDAIIAITRDVVQIEETFVKNTTLEVDGKSFGYINIPSFYRDFEQSRFGQGRNSTRDTREAIAELKKQGIEGIILDLRNNGGGSLVDAVDITGLFIDDGPVVQVRNSQGMNRILEDNDKTLVYGGPLVVLVNRFSASASEIVAAALQDYGRAVIVGGQHTHGKGTVQTILDLNENIPLLHLRRYDDLGALKATIQKFYRVNGGSTQYGGVVPDIILPSLYKYLESGEQYLDYSLKSERVQPVAYKQYSDKVVDLGTIVERSRARVEASEELRLIEAEAERSSVRAKQSVIELDLDSMRARRAEEQKARETVGVHFTDLENEELGDDAGAGEASSAADGDSDADWTVKLSKDPWIIESEMIINDLVHLLKQ